MCECIMIAPQRTASMIGFSVPAANGAMVRGIRAAETVLSEVRSIESKNITLALPLKDPVIASMSWAWGVCRCWVVGYNQLDAVVPRIGGSIYQCPG
jgi:hypothetical protein